MILDAWYNNAGFILLLLLVSFGVIGLTAWIIKKYVVDKRKLLKDEKEPEKTQEEIVEEELDRVLEDVSDEETAKEIKNYEEKDD